jgi:hypothetical protein
MHAWITSTSSQVEFQQKAKPGLGLATAMNWTRPPTPINLADKV